MKEKNTRPANGDTLTLAMDYWNDIKKGTKAVVISTRKDRVCASGLRIQVTILGLDIPKKLDARWFEEFDKDFIYA